MHLTFKNHAELLAFAREMVDAPALEAGIDLLTITVDAQKGIIEGQEQKIGKLSREKGDLEYTITDLREELRYQKQLVNSNESYMQNLRTENERLLRERFSALMQAKCGDGNLKDLVAANQDAAKQILATMFPGNKIAQIKEVRVLFGLGLKEAKDFVEGAPLPANFSPPVAVAS